MSSGFLGIDLDAAPELANLVGLWQPAIDDAILLIAEGEALAQLSTGAILPLDQIGADGSSMATAIQTAHGKAASFQIGEIPVVDPLLGLFLDLPVGAEFDPEVADEAIARGETYRQVEIRREIERLNSLSHPEHSAGHHEILSELRAEYEAIDPLHKGDMGGTLSAEVRDPFNPNYGPNIPTNFSEGLAVITHGLYDSGDEEQIRVDEFQAIFHDNGQVTLVLPGVIDLSSPHLGWDPTSRSARDIDMAATISSLSTGIDGNVYAQLVRDWVQTQVETGVIPRGTEVLIVGHSFGADTALDLASDPDFNGGLVNITHVVPAAYHSEPQLDDVVNGTQVGVLQNIYDVPVIVEGISDELIFGPPFPFNNAGDDVARVGVEGVEEVVGAGAHVLNAGGWFLEELVGATTGMGGNRIDIEIPNLPTDIEILEHRIDTIDGVGFIAEFEGGFEGVGHHQNNYVNYLQEDDLHGVVTDFVSDVGSAGYGGPGVSIAVDISVPLPAPADYGGPPPVPNPGPVFTPPTTTLPPVSPPTGTTIPTPIPTPTAPPSPPVTVPVSPPTGTTVPRPVPNPGPVPTPTPTPTPTTRPS